MATQTQPTTKKLIDVEKVIASKNPRLLKWMPRFVLNYIKRIVHQDDINREVQQYGHLDPIEYARYVLGEKFHINVTSEGLEHIPPTGGAILVANHPLGGIDALALVHELAKRRRDFVFLVNDVFPHLPQMRPIFRGVNTLGKSSASELRSLHDFFASDKLIVIFPAGLVSRKDARGQIRDLPWRKTFVTQAKRFRKPVIPTLIQAPPLSKRFYRIHQWRQKLGIRANLELFYLVDEQYRLNNTHIHIVFGKPLPWHHFDDSKSDRAWAEWMRHYIYTLKS